MNAAGAAFLEEVVVLAYLITRLRQLAWSPSGDHRGERAAARLATTCTKGGAVSPATS